MLKTAKDLMKTALVTIRQSAGLEELAVLMDEENVHGVPVLDEYGKPVGVVSRTDLAATLAEDTDPRAPAYRSALEVEMGDAEAVPYANIDPDLRVKDIMSTRLVKAAPDATVGALARQMLREKVHRVLIAEGEKLLGIVSSTDLLSCLSDYEKALAKKS